MIPLKYNAGNLKARRVATMMTIAGIGVVIAVMLSMMALYRGVVSQFVASGSDDLLLVMQDGLDAELSSGVTLDEMNVIRTLPGVAAVVPQLVIVFKLPKKDDRHGANVTVRGTTSDALTLRPYVHLVQGRMFRPGSAEMIVARRIRDRFVGADLGDTFRFGARTWTVVGVFDAQGTAFDSEMWCDAVFLQQAQKRKSFSSLLVKPASRSNLPGIAAAVRNDLRLQLQAKTEHAYYADQSKGLEGIKRLVAVVTFFMIGAAVFGTMNTMFSAVASRSRELATLRALGFGRRAILASIVFESGTIALLGGLAGVLLSLPVNFISTGTMNPRTMSEVAFNFRVDANVAMIGIAIAIAAGIAGGLLPALNAATKPITRALREIG